MLFYREIHLHLIKAIELSNAKPMFCLNECLVGVPVVDHFGKERQPGASVGPLSTMGSSGVCVGHLKGNLHC